MPSYPRVLPVLAAVLRVAAGLTALLVAIGIVFVVFQANAGNAIVSGITRAAHFVVGPFDHMFLPKERKARVVVNWGIAAGVYLLGGYLLARAIAAVSGKVSGRRSTMKE